jgi:hypothetical protein
MCLTNAWWTAEDGATDLDFIRAHEHLSPLGTHHKCISSADLVTKFRERAKSLNLTLQNEKAGLEKRGRKFMYLAEVKDDSHTDYALTIGFRNFSDRTLSYSTIAGTQVFVCSNGVCNAICKDSKMRHCIGNVDKNVVDRKIDLAFSHFIEDKDRIHGQIETMKSTRLTDEIVGRFMKGLVGNQYIGAANAMRILEDLENPERNDHNDSSVMRLMNSASHITSHHITNPNQGAMASNFCNDLIMRLISPDYVPLGDVIDVE